MLAVQDCRCATVAVTTAYFSSLCNDLRRQHGLQSHLGTFAVVIRYSMYPATSEMYQMQKCIFLVLAAGDEHCIMQFAFV